jgi:tetrameric-type glycyl-tRNA synthetase beta subunit
MVVAGLVDLEPSLALRAAQLCKCDLLSDMVGEFASLQGVMGRYYASAAGEDACVAAAIEEHYLPRQAGDRLPASACGQALAIADRLDSLVGIFAIGQRPTGVKDPYGLRRASLGVLRILIETPLELDLHTLLAASATTLADRVDSSRAAREVFDYMMERLHAYYADRGITGDVVDAVLELGPTVPVDIDRRVQAVAKFRALAEAESLAAANKRIRNILKKTDEAIPAGVDTGLLHESSERELAAALEGMRERVQPLFEAGDYAGALAHLAGLRPAVDRFFDAVMVMSEDTAVRGNRLALVRSVAELFANVADISMLQVGAG